MFFSLKTILVYFEMTYADNKKLYFLKPLGPKSWHLVIASLSGPP